jgi:hypothetical protein
MKRRVKRGETCEKEENNNKQNKERVARKLFEPKEKRQSERRENEKGI